MTRQSYIQIDGQLVDKNEYQARPEAGFFILEDLKAYRSMVTGEMIEGRASHREHLRRHNVVEIGDAYDKRPPPPKTLTSPQGLRETLARVAYEKLRY
jgi:hypothetical protein